MLPQLANGLTMLRVGILVFRAHNDDPESRVIAPARRQHGCNEGCALRSAQRKEQGHDTLHVSLEADVLLNKGAGGRAIGVRCTFPGFAKVFQPRGPSHPTRVRLHLRSQSETRSSSLGHHRCIASLINAGVRRRCPEAAPSDRRNVRALPDQASSGLFGQAQADLNCEVRRHRLTFPIVRSASEMHC